MSYLTTRKGAAEKDCDSVAGQGVQKGARAAITWVYTWWTRWGAVVGEIAR